MTEKKCPKCGAQIPAESLFCFLCGKKLSVPQKKRPVKIRGNGQGTAFKRGQTWTACVTVDWKKQQDPSKPKIPIRRTKGGFATKKDAIAYCPVLLSGGVEKPTEAPRLSSYWKTYSEGPMLKISKGKQSAYKTAWNPAKPSTPQKTANPCCPICLRSPRPRNRLSGIFRLSLHYRSTSLPNRFRSTQTSRKKSGKHTITVTSARQLIC